MKQIQHLKNALIFRSKENAHRYFYMLNGKLCSFVTDRKDALSNLAAMFGNLNAGFSTASSQFIRSSMALGALGVILSSSLAYALPTGYESAAGNVQFNQSDATTLNVTTQAARSIANYRTFNIDRGETVNFILPGASASILNRVTGGSPSQIFGSINSNGQVFLVNPSGILFGATSQVNVGSLFASTQSISNQDFLNGKLIFKQETGFGPAAVVNQGKITTQKGGFAVLTGAAVQNSGDITVPQGQVTLAVGDQISLMIDDNMAVQVTVDEALKQKVEAYQDALSNTGSIKANGGAIQLQAELENNLYSHLVNNEGLLQAQGIAEGADGSITLLAHAETGNGLVRNAGIVDASGSTSSPNGGKITVEGDYITQRGQLLAEGAEQGNGGTIAIKSLQGTLLADGSLTSVRGAGAHSTAGRILINSDQNTYFRSGATLDARGGSQSGNGGFVEVSGKEAVYVEGTAKGGAVNGKAGSILIDPKDIIIGNGGANTIDITPPELQADVPGGPDESFTESAGQTVTYNPQAGGAFNGFGDIHLQATNNITVSSPFDTTIATGNPSVSLKLEANNTINVNAAITTQNAALDLIADADANGAGNLNINAALASNNGNITLQGNQLNLTQTVNAGTGTVTIAPTNTSRSIALGDATGGFDISNAELNQITARNLVIGTDLQSGRINIGSANLSAKATDLTLKTTGTITDNDTVDDSVANILLATNQNLTITGGVGGIGSGMVGASSGLGDINIVTAGTGSVSITTNNAALALQNNNNLLVNNISTGSGDVTLRSNGSIQDMDGASGITNTGTLTLTSNGAIGQGTANPLDISTGNISVTSTNGNDISLRENGPMTVKSITTGAAGTVRLASTSTIDDTQGGDAITTTGNLILSSNGAIGNGAGDHVGTNIGGTVQVLTTGGNDVRLNQTGNLVISSITTGGAGTVDLTSTGSITDTGAAPSIISAGGLTLTSKGAIGNSPASPLDITVGSVTVKSTNGNDINLHATNPLLIADINTGDTGNINLRSDATIGNAGALGAITTKGSLTLASNGAIGNIADPLRLQVGQVNVTGTNGNDIALSELSQLTIGDISTGGAGNIALLATTSIQDGGAGEHLHTTGSLTLTAGNNIGTDANPLGIDVAQVSVTNANNVNLAQTANMVVNAISAQANVNLQSGGSITDTGVNVPSVTTPGHLTLTSNGTIGNGAANPLDTQVGILSVNSTGGNNIALRSTGPLKFQSISTGGAGNVFLSSTSTIGDNAVGDTISTTGTVSLNSAGAIGSFFNPIGLNTGNLSITSTGGSDVFLTKTGDLTIDGINTGGAGNVNLTATGGIFGNGNTTHITTDGILNLLASGDIGSPFTPLQTHIGGLNILGTANNNVFLLDDHTLNIASVLAGNGVVQIGAFGDLNLQPGGLIQGSDILLGALGGGMNLNGNVGEAGNTLFSTLLASNTIQGSGTIFADFIDLLSALGNIGNSLGDRVNTNGLELTLNAPNGSVFVNHFGGGVNIVDDNTAQGAFAVTTVEPGDITVDGTINAGAISLMTTGSSIFINNNITGNDSVLLSAATDGNITGPGLISGNNVTLAAVNGNIIANTNATALAVNTLGTTVNITESNSVNLANSSSGGVFNLTTGTALPGIFDPNSTGTLLFIGETAAQNINITAAGSILSATTRGNNIRATGDSSLIANGGILGTLRRPIRVDVRGGTLSVAASAKRGQYSGVLVGKVRPSNSLRVLNKPPGIILFNGFPQPAFDPSQVLATLIYPYKYSADPNYVSTAQTIASLTTPASILNVEANIINEVPTEQPFDLRLIEESAEPGVENGPVNYLLIDTSSDEEEKKRIQNKPKELRQ